MAIQRQNAVSLTIESSSKVSHKVNFFSLTRIIENFSMRELIYERKKSGILAMRKVGFGTSSDWLSFGQILQEFLTKEGPEDRYTEKEELRLAKICNCQCLLEIEIPDTAASSMKKLIEDCSLIHSRCRMRDQFFNLNCSQIVLDSSRSGTSET